MSAATESYQPDLLSQLRADLSARWGRGECGRVEDYLERYPELADSPEGVAGLVYAEVLQREAHGDVPTLSEYQARFPDHREAIARQWQVHRLIREGGLVSLTPAEGRDILTEPQATPPLPASFPGLVLLEELGRGGMGVVHRARQLDLDRVVAVKTVRGDPAEREQLAERFRTEAKAVGRLGHAGVVQVFGFGEIDGCLYLVMEHMPGGNLAKKLRAGPLPPREAAALVAKLARAMDAAHEANVVHRDLKPGNVLLTEEGEPKISDFGLARLLDAEVRYTRTGTVMGTPAYMAPEQASGGVEEIGQSADVWALGVILYECLSGRLPFAGEDKFQVLRAVREAEPAPLPGEVPAGLAAVCLACLRKRPGDRYATAGQLAEALGRWLAGQEVRPPAPEWTRRAVLGAWVAAALGGIGAWIGLSGGSPDNGEGPVGPAKAPREEAEERLRDGRPFELRGSEPLPGPLRAMLRDVGPVAAPAEGCFWVETLDIALVELLAPPCDRYDFSAQVRHDRATRFSDVGIYFAYREAHAPGKRRECAWYTLSFDERGEEAQRVDKRLGRRVSYVKLAGHLLEDDPAISPVPHTRLGVQSAFEPSLSLARPGPWRWLQARVTPEGITASWLKEPVKPGQPAERIGVLPRPALEGFLKEPAQQLAKLVGKFGHAPAEFSPRGGLGLFVRGGKASFRRITVTPIRGE